MVYIDTTRPGRELSPGIDLWAIRECVAKRSRKGDNMLAIKFERVSDSGDHLYENVMLEGAGWEIGKEKLAALLEPGFKGDLDPLALIGRRLWVSTTVREYEGKSSLSVNIDELRHKGLQREEDVPPGCTPPPPPEDLSGVPF